VHQGLNLRPSRVPEKVGINLKKMRKSKAVFPLEKNFTIYLKFK
jgi:hypothetical protein